LEEEPNRSDDTVAERFTAAYQQLSPAVLGYLRSHGVDDPEATTHEVFLALFRTLDRTAEGGDDVRTMTFSIAHARVVDHHRARTRRPFTVSYDPDSDPRSAPSAEESVTVKLGQHGILPLVNRLEDEQREAVLLRVVAGLTLDETAQVMSKSVGAIKQLQRRGLQSLRSSLNAGSPRD
jgi:RNA polymerase sigma-70 factor (ECF subfamily)